MPLPKAKLFQQLYINNKRRFAVMVKPLPAIHDDAHQHPVRFASHGNSACSQALARLDHK